MYLKCLVKVTMTQMLVLVIIVLKIISRINCIWPPEYKVNLKYDEEFVISELLQPSDVQDVYDEEELIREEDLKTLELYKKMDSNKYFRLHNSLSERKNWKIEQQKVLVARNLNSGKHFPEFNPELEETKPWIAGFVDTNNKIARDEDTIYFDENAKSNNINDIKLEKRGAENGTDNKDYNYENLKSQYDETIKQADSKNDTLKYKEVKEEETPAEAVKTLVDVEPKNCTEEEKAGLGIGAVRCFLKETREKHFDKKKKYYMLKKITGLALIWLFVYAIIAIPLWCQYGWCCCCCRCKFCHPRDKIDEIKTFVATNPPGVYHDEEGNLKKYKATPYEIYAQKNLEKAIQQL